MITEIKEIYKCEYCKKIYQIKHFAISHEPKCKKNPVNKQKCLEGCSNLIKKEITYFYDDYNGSNETKREILYCTAKKEGVYPFWVTGLNSEDIENDLTNNVMPSECDKFKPYS